MGNRLIDIASSRSHDKGILEKQYTFQAEFPNIASFPLPLVRARLIQKGENHDVLELDFKGRVTSPMNSVSNGDPVRFVYGAENVTREWVGYVHHVVPHVSSAATTTRVVCVSASYNLKDSAQKVYANVTADQVISRIAAANGLQAVTQRHPRVHATISNAGQSLWQLMRRLAKQSGFALVVDNTTIKFQSKDQMYADSMRKGLYFEYRDPVTPATTTYSTLFSFDPIISDNAPELSGGRVERVVGGINKVTNQPINTRHPAKKPGRTQGRGVKGSKQ